MARNHGAQIKDDERYEALRKHGASKEKAARIANASANPRQHPEREGGKSPPYEQWSAKELRQRAREIGIEGCSKMDKGELIEAIRRH